MFCRIDTFLLKCTEKVLVLKEHHKLTQYIPDCNSFTFLFRIMTYKSCEYCKALVPDDSEGEKWANIHQISRW